MPFLFGLDMLRKFSACIDLKRNCLNLMGEDIPFLSEKEVSNDISAAAKSQPLSLNSQLTSTKSNMSATAANNLIQSTQFNPATQQPTPSAPQIFRDSNPVLAPSNASNLRPLSNQTGAQATEAAVQQLLQMGIGTREQIVEALRVTGGNADAAASLLMFG